MEHCGRIGPALWEFVWLIDKITEEADGKGIVLGGAPVKIARIANDLARGEHTVRRNLDRLESENYVERTRTPYGFAIRVRNSHKFQIWSGKENVKIGHSLESDRPKVTVRSAKSDGENVIFGRNKEDAAVDATEDAAVATAPVPNSPNPWKLLGSDLPMGSPRFQRIVEHFFATRNGNPLKDAMERAIQLANKRGIKVPPPFFDAKRVVECREAEEFASPAGSERPELEDLPWGKR
jgi:hypothetical protein